MQIVYLISCNGAFSMSNSSFMRSNTIAKSYKQNYV